MSRFLALFAVAFVALQLPVLAQTRSEVVSGKLGRLADEWLTDAEAYGFAGVCQIQKGTKTVFRKAYGEAQPGVPNTVETLYDLASASKQITAAAIFLLAHEKRLDLDDSIVKHLKDVPEEHAEVTLYHLLTHTSGWPRYGKSGSGLHRDSAMRDYLSQKRYTKAGAAFEYYNGGYAMLAAVVERVTGEDFHPWVKEHLFEEAGLVDTGFIEDRGVDTTRVAMSWDGSTLATDYIVGWGYRGMGGVLTNVDDVCRWVRALVKGDVIPKRSLKRMFEPNREFYACGWFVGGDPYGQPTYEHGGDANDLGSYIRHYPDKDLTIALFLTDGRIKLPLVNGLSQALAGVRPDRAKLSDRVELKEAQEKRFVGEWEGSAGRFRLERFGGSYRLSALSGGIVTYLQPPDPGKRPNPLRPNADPLKSQTDMAVRIVDGLKRGQNHLVAELMADTIPKNWPKTLRDYVWAKHVKEHGKVASTRATGAARTGDSDYVTVWVELEHEGKGVKTTGAKVFFQGARLVGFEMFATPRYNAVRLAPVKRDELFAADIGTQITFRLRSSKKGDTLRLVRKGQEHAFTRTNH